jgi:carnitine-CoA ligase
VTAIQGLHGGDFNISGLLAAHAIATPRKLFARCDDQLATYSEVQDAAGSIAAMLGRTGIEPGDRIAYLCPYRVEVVKFIFGVALVGGVNAVLNIFLRGDFLTHQLVDSDPSALVVDAAGLSTALTVIDSLPRVRHIFVVDDHVDIDGETKAAIPEDVELTVWADVPSVPTGPFDSVTPHSDDPFAFVYTSGTTGMPKACVYDYAFIRRLADVYARTWAITAADTIYTATPLYHIAGYVGLMTALSQGASLVVDTTYSASRYILHAGDVGATVAYGIGFHVVAALAQPELVSDRSHSLRLGWFGPLDTASASRFEERFGFPIINEMYASTECSLVSAGVPGVRSDANGGKPLDDIEVRLVDDHDNDVPLGAVGEITLRSSAPGALFCGYWNQPDATVSAWRHLWHHTGDLGRLNPDGSLSWVDRKSDAMRRRGEMVSAFELERVIAAHPLVVDVASYGVKVDDEVDDAIKVCIVTEGRGSGPVEELAEYFAANLPYFAIPRFVEFMDDLPSNGSGKVMKYVLRNRPNDLAFDLQALGLLPERSARRSGHGGGAAMSRGQVGRRALGRVQVRAGHSTFQHPE